MGYADVPGTSSPAAAGGPEAGLARSTTGGGGGGGGLDGLFGLMSPTFSAGMSNCRFHTSKTQRRNVRRQVSCGLLYHSKQRGSHIARQ